MARKRVAMQTRHCATPCKPETKKTGDSSNTCVGLHRSLKPLTDKHRDFVAVNLETD